ncbi:hypothetical protein GUJ93_ZPchr0008g11458 [Zizania palustris]|uniref:Uncharacterized protein n=1 Tax=Zizania palustris TaxID=103762 RepID=A0A8J5VIE6_ZIZPA|nr:hypothetical protein GUJ93_ZPchr0008g11458 [Zizania palustris]
MGRLGFLNPNRHPYTTAGAVWAPGGASGRFLGARAGRLLGTRGCRRPGVWAGRRLGAQGLRAAVAYGVAAVPCGDVGGTPAGQRSRPPPLGAHGGGSGATAGWASAGSQI